MERLAQQQAFVEAHGWADADIFPLPPDASTRSYTRLVLGNKTCLLVDASPATEKLPEFILIGDYLRQLGVRPPRIYASDLKLGFALIEDFGDATFTQLFAGGEDEKHLYEQATDVLIHVRRKVAENPAIELPAYDLEVLLEEVSRFLRWYVPAVRGSEATDTERAAFMGAWRQALAEISQDRSSFVFRDFHVDNLMIVSDGDGLSAIGLLDFQDALIGSPMYDLMSLLRDARRDISVETEQFCLKKYFAAFPEDDQAEACRVISLLSAQRQIKIAGIFARMALERDMPKFLVHMPRIRRMITRDLSITELQPIWQVIKAILPNFETDEIRLP